MNIHAKPIAYGRIVSSSLVFTGSHDDVFDSSIDAIQILVLPPVYKANKAVDSQCKQESSCVFVYDRRQNTSFVTTKERARPR